MLSDVALRLDKTSIASQVVRCCEAKGYPLSKRSGDVNIVAIEGMDPDGTFNLDRPDQWNDTVGILSFDGENNPRFDILCKATTEPGRHHTTVELLNSRGAARLDTGYHKGLWNIGKHRGYEALAQNGNLARLVRDGNRNYRRDDKTTYEAGVGINLHTTKSKSWRGSALASSIGSWSAGCVVIYSPSEFLKLMKLVKESRQYRKNRSHSFDFILLWSGWLQDSQVAAPASTSRPIPVIETDIDVLARTIWGEARGESYEGKAAVAWVIQNRASRSPKYNWPSTVRAVCQQKWQFSCWNSNDPNLPKLKAVTAADPSFAQCLDIAKKVVSGDLPDYSKGADHYYNPKVVSPSWAIGRDAVAEIGNHRFLQLVH